MTDPTSQPASTAMQAVPAQERYASRFFLAALLSALVPGTGHFLAKRRLKGLLLLAVFVVWSGAYCWLRLPRTIYGMLLPVLVLVGLCVFASWDVAYSGKVPHTKPSQWWLAALLPAALIAGSAHLNWAVRVSGFRTFSVPATSMAPAIPEGSRIVADLRYFQRRAPQRGDIIVFQAPMTPGVILLKRVIAVGGETIRIEGDSVLINGEPLPEPYAMFDGPILDPTIQTGSTTLPAGKLFVMGDNRRVSLDSRYEEFGLVDVTTVGGKVIYALPSFQSDIKYFN
jgi:signal peptidase I